MSFTYRLDITRCIGCRACEVACVTANDLPPENSRNRVPYLEADGTARSQATFAPYLCHQCEEPPCVPACPTGASFVAEDGRVLVERELCIGCGLCEPACPYEARYTEPATDKLEKCTLCEGRVQAGLAPACFDVCPAGARHFEERLPDGSEVRVGDPERLDPGHVSSKLVDEAVDPKPRLVFSGLAEDLELLKRDRPPLPWTSAPSSLWRNGAGVGVQAVGVASMAAMAGMVGLNWLRGRKSREETD